MNPVTSCAGGLEGSAGVGPQDVAGYDTVVVKGKPQRPADECRMKQLAYVHRDRGHEVQQGERVEEGCHVVGAVDKWYRNL